MIYTSYFANVKNLPKEIIPISIAGKAPNWWKGIEYKKLAPKYGFWKIWKEENKGEDFYKEHYYDEVLKNLNVDYVVMDLYKLSGNCDIALICYEKPENFCHRQLVARWLTTYGYITKEFEKESYENWINMYDHRA